MRGLVGIGVAGAILAGCSVPAPPQLVRDGARLFSDSARATADERLRGASSQHGIWLFVITADDADPPRMLDEPMALADGWEIPAVAVLFGRDRIVATGYSEQATPSDAATLSPPSAVDRALELGDTDEALALTVDYLVRWAATPQQAAPPAQPGGPAGVPTMPGN